MVKITLTALSDRISYHLMKYINANLLYTPEIQHFLFAEMVACTLLLEADSQWHSLLTNMVPKITAFHIVYLSHLSAQCGVPCHVSAVQKKCVSIGGAVI